MNKYLTKVAQLSEERKSDLTNTAVLGTLGGAEAMGAAKLLNHPRISGLSGKTKFGIGAGLTLATDYAGLKLGKAINKWRGAAPRPTQPTKDL